MHAWLWHYHCLTILFGIGLALLSLPSIKARCTSRWHDPLLLLCHRTCERLFFQALFTKILAMA